MPLEEAGTTCARLQGLSLRNVALALQEESGKAVYRDFGELLFTHFGLSGPIVLSASARVEPGKRYRAVLDLKPALDEEKLDARLLRDFSENPNRDLHNVLDALVPRLMSPVLAELSGIPGETKVNSVTREQRRRLLELLKGLRVDIRGPRPVEEAIISSGGVKVTEVDPKTMGSKLVSGLYFAGELLDVDAYTGGFNLQIAWATGRAAGEAAAAAL